MRDILFIDFETRSEMDVSKVGSHRYLTDSSTEMIMVSYAFNDEPTQVAEFSLPDRVAEAIENPKILKVAHNAEFDMGVCKYLCGLEIRYEDWFDTAYQASYYGYPRALKNLAIMLNTKRKASQEELMMFSIPVQRKSDKKDTLFSLGDETVYNTKETHPVQWEAFRQYAICDVDVMRDCFRLMAPLPAIEIFSMRVTFEMNFNGVPLDLKFAKQISDMEKDYRETAGRIALEKYGISNLRSVPQVKEALKKEGIYLGSLNVKERLGAEHEILDLREKATGAAFAKIPKMFERVCADGRLRGEFVGHGAHTGRWTARGVQLHNLTRIYGKVSDDLSKVESYSNLREHMRLILGNLRGYNFTCADLSQIEARIVAWLAGCKWRIEAFKNKEDIYARSAEKMFGIPHVSKHDPERHDGKCAELGFGYGGGVNAIRNINYDFYVEKGERKLQALVDMWRAANPEICALWRKLDRAMREAIATGGARLTLLTTTIYFAYDGRTMRVTLPSGRALYYRDVRLVETSRGSDIVYTDYTGRGAENGMREKMWGGTILENITQAIAKDVLIDIMRRVKQKYAELQPIGTVHDEIWYLSSVGLQYNPLEALLREMSEEVSWAKGLVLSGDGFTDKRYIK